MSAGVEIGELKDELRAGLQAQLRAEFQAEVGQLRDRVGQLEDQQAVRALQFKYGMAAVR